MYCIGNADYVAAGIVGVADYCGVDVGVGGMLGVGANVVDVVVGSVICGVGDVGAGVVGSVVVCGGGVGVDIVGTAGVDVCIVGVCWCWCSC